MVKDRHKSKLKLRMEIHSMTQGRNVVQKRTKRPVQMFTQGLRAEKTVKGDKKGSMIGPRDPGGRAVVINEGIVLPGKDDQ